MATAAGRRVYVAESVSADLAFILVDAGVDEQLRFDITQHYKTVRRFSALNNDRASVRAALLADFALNPADGAAVRAQVGAVVSAWEASSDFIEVFGVSGSVQFTGGPFSKEEEGEEAALVSENVKLKEQLKELLMEGSFLEEKVKLQQEIARFFAADLLN